ncbi:MAG: class I SAM-dependent methyltransferase [Bacillota bacterium]
MKDRYKVIMNPKYGYRHLAPLPTAEKLNDFYREQYYDLVAAGGRAPGEQRLMQGGGESNSELVWLSKTTWSDIQDTLEQHLSHKKERWLLDVGSGPGCFGKYMQEAGWHVVGIEPSGKAAEIARSSGITVFNSVEECFGRVERRFDAIVLLQVLEHILDPAGLIQSLRRLMLEQSILVIQVPNDFSAIQECACGKLNLEPWWITAPDHINYFNFESLVGFLRKLDFQVVEMFGDFPMEMFLFFGDIYVGNPDIGSQVHKKRMAFELALPSELRRNLYRCFAGNGLGRRCLVFAQPLGDEQ